MLAALIMGGVVCTALSVAGSFITDLKIGYWLGTTPKKQEGWKFLGTLVSAATVGGVMMLLNETYGFASGSLAAPQANAMAAVIDPLMNGVGAPWILYGIGAVIAIVLTYFKIPACFCPGYVYSAGTERSAAGRWCHQLVCYFAQQGCQGECGAWREGYAHRQRFHCRWSLDGCGQRPTEVWRH